MINLIMNVGLVLITAFASLVAVGLLFQGLINLIEVFAKVIK